jgi:hypothetical protein
MPRARYLSTVYRHKSDHSHSSSKREVALPQIDKPELETSTSEHRIVVGVDGSAESQRALEGLPPKRSEVVPSSTS